MTSEWIRIERDAVLNGIFAFTASATRALKTMLRERTRPRWLLFLAIAGGAVLGVAAIKLLALLRWTLDWSWFHANAFLRSGSDNCEHWWACLLAAAGAGGGSGGKGPQRGGKPPDKGGKPPDKGGKPPDKGPKDPAPGKGGGNPTYTPTKGSDPLHDPNFQDAQDKYRSHNPQPTPSPADSGGGVNLNHVIQNYFWRKQ